MVRALNLNPRCPPIGLIMSVFLGWGFPFCLSCRLLPVSCVSTRLSLQRWWWNRTRLLRAYSYSFIFQCTCVRGGDSVGHSTWDRCHGPSWRLLHPCWCRRAVGDSLFWSWGRNRCSFILEGHAVHKGGVRVALAWRKLGPRRHCWS